MILRAYRDHQDVVFPGIHSFSPRNIQKHPLLATGGSGDWAHPIHNTKMIFSNSTFIKTQLPVWDNSLKSLIFRVAELLLVFAIWRLFSLLAALQNLFTSYLVFSETPLQKAYFVFTRRFSKDGFLVAAFTLVYAAAQLYGTLLWAMDAPGHVIRASHAPASSVSTSFLDTPDYKVSFKVSNASLGLSDSELNQAMSANLFRPGTNVSLDGMFEQGTPESVPPPRRGGGPRIWLDSEGWSVSTDTFFRVAVNLGAPDAEARQLDCGYRENLAGSQRLYNCTFDNAWVPDLLEQSVIGVPLVHYTEHADRGGKIGRIPPARDDIWTAMGRSSGAAMRIHMFTVTKGRRRHTFVSTIVKSSIVSTDGLVSEQEMRKLMKRVSVAPNPQDQPAIDEGISSILSTFTTAQRTNQSAVFGTIIGDAKPNQLLENFWESLTLNALPGQVVLGVFRLTSVNITLLRSETLNAEPIPAEACVNRAFQNKAFGGKVTMTDCIDAADLASSTSNNTIEYFGQVDTSAVLNLNGLDHPPYASSDAALDPILSGCVDRNMERFTRLVLSRGYILGINPDIVSVETTEAIPGISHLQLLLVITAGALAVISWLGLWLGASSGHWSSSLLVNLLTTTDISTHSKWNFGMVCRIPDIYLRLNKGGKSSRVEMATDRGVFIHQERERREVDGSIIESM